MANQVIKQNIKNGDGQEARKGRLIMMVTVRRIRAASRRGERVIMLHQVIV